jgi:arylformamidase
VLYREFTNQAQLDDEYNPALRVGNLEAMINGWFAASERVRVALGGGHTMHYGPTKAEFVDVFPAQNPGAPIHVFIHGGYWTYFSSKEFAFVAEPFYRRGVTTVVVNYALCPRVTIDEIVRQCRAALAWVFRNAEGFGGDPARISVSGHSAGGHLAGMMLATEWLHDYGLPQDLVKACCAVSGLFDLEPFPFTWLQPSLQLTWGEIRRQSPLRHLPAQSGPIIVAVGSEESAEFHRQAAAYEEALKGAGIEPEHLELKGRNHFTLLEDLTGTGGPLFEAILSKIGDPLEDRRALREEGR